MTYRPADNFWDFILNSQKFKHLTYKTYPFKSVRIMLETWILVYKYTHMYFQKVPRHQGVLNFADFSIFFAKNSIFWQKKLLLKAIVWELC